MAASQLTLPVHYSTGHQHHVPPPDSPPCPPPLKTHPVARRPACMQAGPMHRVWPCAKLYLGKCMQGPCTGLFVHPRRMHFTHAVWPCAEIRRSVFPCRGHCRPIANAFLKPRTLHLWQPMPSLNSPHPTPHATPCSQENSPLTAFRPAPNSK